jgi:hypothetical protein
VPEVVVNRDQLTDFDDFTGQVSVAQNTTKTNVLSVTGRNNCKTYLAFIGMAWDSGANNQLTWRLLLDGGKIRQFGDSLVQIAPPEQPWQEITPWLLIPQGSTLRFEVDIGAAAGGPFNVAARMRIYYAPLPQIDLPGR